jgi:hypothetical protein
MTTGIVLDPADQIASGVQRAVYLHPHDPTKLIKVLKPAADMPKRNNFNGIVDRLFPSTRVRQIRKEYQEYLRVMLDQPDADFRPPMAHMFGFATTNLGLGCITERVMNADGSLGQTIGKRAKSKSLTQADVDLLNDTISRIYGYNIRASDMNPNNFVIGHRDNGSGPGPKECVLVDGFGDIHAIPVRSMSNWTNKIGLDDSCARLARNTKMKWDAKARQLSL